LKYIYVYKTLAHGHRFSKKPKLNPKNKKKEGAKCVANIGNNNTKLYSSYSDNNNNNSNKTYNNNNNLVANISIPRNATTFQLYLDRCTNIYALKEKVYVKI